MVPTLTVAECWTGRECRPVNLAFAHLHIEMEIVNCTCTCTSTSTNWVSSSARCETEKGREINRQSHLFMFSFRSIHKLLLLSLSLHSHWSRFLIWRLVLLNSYPCTIDLLHSMSPFREKKNNLHRFARQNVNDWTIVRFPEMQVESNHLLPGIH